MDKRRTDVLKASPRMFESNLLDRLSRVHPVVPLIIFIPAIAVLFALGQEGTPPLEVIVWIAGGWIFWTLTEYWLHRLVFHFEPEGGIGARLHWIIHGVHHDHPNDPMRLVMPPSVSVPLAIGFWALFHWAIGGQSADLFACGFLVGYLAYDMTHYHLHHHKPRTRLGRTFYELHMRHHFQDHTRGFGVAAPWWDAAFGTRLRRRGKTRD
jgi:sterol desaturase/sphingolipid hydroxylase (fatty acid hydroxylase superfamily)